MATMQAGDAHVRDLIRELNGLSEHDFAQALADNIKDEDPDETAAFRSPELAQRSYVATRFLIEQVNNQIQRETGESNKAWERRALHFRTQVGRERRLLEAIVAGLRATNGVLSNAPNPTQRAYRELAANHPVEFVALKRKHREAIAEEVRAAKEARRAERAQARRLRMSE